MAEFLVGEELSEKIREVVQGRDVRCAVAFWGAGAVQDLFGTETLDRQDVRIICDISMGGTNPSTLRNLRAPNNEKLHHIEGLHAKLYLSDCGMVVGSANASNNAIGFMSEVAQLKEAGVFIGADAQAYRTAKSWFDENFRSSGIVDTVALARGQMLWGNRYFANNRAPFVVNIRDNRVRPLIDYKPEIHGVVYINWYENDIGIGVEFNENAPNAIRGDINQKWANLARGDEVIQGSWVCSFLLTNEGLMHANRSPEFFFVDSILNDAIENNEEYPLLAFQGNIEPALAPPFDLSDRNLPRIFCEVINRPAFADLRNAQGIDGWRLMDHKDRMVEFWRSVIETYAEHLQA